MYILVRVSFVPKCLFSAYVLFLVSWGLLILRLDSVHFWHFRRFLRRPICFQQAYLLCPRRWGGKTRWAVRSVCSTSATPLNRLSPDLSNAGRERLVRMVAGVMLVVQLAGMPSKGQTTKNAKTWPKTSKTSRKIQEILANQYQNKAATTPPILVPKPFFSLSKVARCIFLQVSWKTKTREVTDQNKLLPEVPGLKPEVQHRNERPDGGQKGQEETGC